jgi:predicted aspartyl protease
MDWRWLLPACCNPAVIRTPPWPACAGSLLTAVACAFAALSVSSAQEVPPAANESAPTAPTAAPAQPDSRSQQGAPSQEVTLPSPILEEPVSEVVVQAPEPRYVAPTLRDRIGRIWAPVLINGKGPFRLVLDTGASRSAVTSRVVQSLGVTLSPEDTLLVRGFTGSAVVPALPVESMEIGELYIQSTILPVVADVFGGAEGILGNEGMKDKRIYIDFGRDRVSINRSHGERPGRGFSVIPMKITKEGLLQIDVRIGVTKTHAIIDTGAQRTVGNTALRLALNKRSSGKAVSEQVIGVTLDSQTGQSLPSPRITFGTFTISGSRLTFGDMYLFEHWKLTRQPAIFIGMDVLGLVDSLVIDYKLREMHIRPRGAPGARTRPGEPSP